jgi:malic enzyme
LDCVAGLKPNVIVGVSAQPGSFSTEVLRLMGELNEQPLVFALSNPTSKVRVAALRRLHDALAALSLTRTHATTPTYCCS